MDKHQAIQTIDLNSLLSALTLEMRKAIKEEVRRTGIKKRKELLSVPEAAKEYGMTEAYWRKQIFHKNIPVIKMGKSVRLRRKDIERFIENNEIPA